MHTNFLTLWKSFDQFLHFFRIMMLLPNNFFQYSLSLLLQIAMPFNYFILIQHSTFHEGISSIYSMLNRFANSLYSVFMAHIIKKEVFISFRLLIKLEFNFFKRLTYCTESLPYDPKIKLRWHLILIGKSVDFLPSHKLNAKVFIDLRFSK